MDKKELLGKEIEIASSKAKATVAGIENANDIKDLKIVLEDGRSYYVYLAITSKAISFVDDAIQEYIVSEINKYDTEQEQHKAHLQKVAKEAIELSKKRIAEEEKNGPTKSNGRSKGSYVRKDRKNIAYKATYCDGNGNWFANPCSKKCRGYNCSQTTRAQFCRTNSICKKVEEGKTAESEIEKARNTNFLCYESRLLVDFKIYAGRHSNDDPMGWELDNDRLVIFTTVFPGMSEADRVIFGAMLVDHSYNKLDDKEAFATSYPDCRIALTEKEAEQMKYWEFAPGEGKDKNLIQWNEKLWRYQSDKTCATVLKELVTIVSKRGEDEAKRAKAFLDKFLAIIKLEEKDIPPKKGAIA